MSMSHVLESRGSAKNTAFYPGDFCSVLSSGHSWDPRLDKSVTVLKCLDHKDEWRGRGILTKMGAGGVAFSRNLKPGGNRNNLLPSAKAIPHGAGGESLHLPPWNKESALCEEKSISSAS